MNKNFWLGLTAVIIWSTLSVLALPLTHVPAYLMTGLSFLVGSVFGIFHYRSFSLDYKVWLLGIFGFFGFHAIYFVAIRMAPPVSAQIIVEFWPILLVFFSVLILGGELHWNHIAGAVLKLIGLLIVGYEALLAGSNEVIGLSLAFLAAVIWALYSVGLKLVKPFSAFTNSGFCLASGILCLICHYFFEPPADLSSQDYFWIVMLGCGPLGLGFYCWDIAIKNGDPKQLGALSYLIIVLATLWLVIFGGQTISLQTLFALGLILVGSFIGNFKFTRAMA